jgi:hypothetical protein
MLCFDAKQSAVLPHVIFIYRWGDLSLSLNVMRHIFMAKPRNKANITDVSRWFGKNWKWMIPLGIVLGLLVGFWSPITGYIGSLFGGSTVTPPPTGQFDIVAWDGPRNLELPNNAFNYTLWGVTGNDLKDFGTFDELAAGDSLSDISAADLDTQYDHWVLRAAGMVEADWWDVDDAVVIDAIDETYNHYYYDRYFVLSKTSKNTLMFYETPSDADFIIVNSQTFAAVNMASNISAPVNVTIFAGTNQSQRFAKYVSGENYPNEEPDTPTWIVTLDDPVSMSWLSMSGAVKTRVNDTALKFTFGVLGPVPSMFNLVWNNADAKDAGVSIISIQLLWSGTTLSVKS